MPFILEPGTSRITEGLRDTGYTVLTAIADIVDNSIAANASKIKILFQTDQNRKINLYIADNGCGMDFEGLKNAMTYGSERREDVHSLGKFGLGLKTASTAFCRCLSLISRPDHGDYYMLQWDLDHIDEVNKWEILEPTPSDDEIDFLEDVNDGGSGTLVVWQKVDRILNRSYKNNAGYQGAFTRLANQIAEHLSMVFQRFIDTTYEGAQNVEIEFNGEILKPWDPFCQRECRTLANGEIDRNGTVLVVNTNPKLTDENDNVLSEATFKAWVIPNKYNYSTQESHEEAKISNNLQGFYVYRENRLIIYGTSLNLFSFDPHYSLLRIDLSFDSSFDEYLNVDIKKSTVRLNDELAYEFDKFIKNARYFARQRYDAKNKTANNDGNSSGAHIPSNQNIKEVEGQIPGQNPGLTVTAGGEVQVAPTDGNPPFVTTTIRIHTSDNDKLTRVIPVETIEGNLLWEPTTTGDGKTAVSINMNHDYYKKIYAPNMNDSNLVMGMDYLLWGLSLAEVRLCNDENKELLQELRNEVSRSLKITLKTIELPED